MIGVLWRLAGVLALVFANGFFVAARYGGRASNAGSMIAASAGSASQPRPSDAIVMPSCVAAM